MASPTATIGNQQRNADGTISISPATTGTEGATLNQINSSAASILTTVAATYAPIISTPRIIASQEINNQSSGIGGLINQSLHAVPNTGSYELSVRLYVDSVSIGTVSITFTYDDDNGHTNILTLANSIAVPGVYTIPSQLIGMGAGGNYSLDSTTTGTIQYDFGGSLTYYRVV